MTIEAAILDLQEKALSLNGVKAAPDSPPESVSVFPFAVSYERLGSTELRSSGFAHDLATIITEIHVSRQLLPKAVEQAMGFRDDFLKLIIADPTLGASVSTVNSLNREFGRLEWGGVETIGYRFSVGVKVLLSST